LKLLFDQNISPRIVKRISSNFPDSTQVRYVGLEDASDWNIFEYARRNDFTIVTFDADFVDLNVINGIPPKIIWLKTGNLTTRFIAELIKKNINNINE